MNIVYLFISSNRRNLHFDTLVNYWFNCCRRAVHYLRSHATAPRKCSSWRLSALRFRALSSVCVDFYFLLFYFFSPSSSFSLLCSSQLERKLSSWPWFMDVDASLSPLPKSFWVLFLFFSIKRKAVFVSLYFFSAFKARELYLGRGQDGMGRGERGFTNAALSVDHMTNTPVSKTENVLLEQREAASRATRARRQRDEIISLRVLWVLGVQFYHFHSEVLVFSCERRKGNWRTSRYWSIFLKIFLKHIFIIYRFYLFVNVILLSLMPSAKVTRKCLCT